MKKLSEIEQKTQQPKKLQSFKTPHISLTKNVSYRLLK